MNNAGKKTVFVTTTIVVASFATAGAADAFENLANSSDRLNRFSLNYRGGFNLHASFRNLGGVPPVSNPGPTGPDLDHTYDDGFVRRDSANGDGLTWNWGYDSAAQVPGNDTIEFHSSQSSGNGSIGDADADSAHGVEIGYQRQLGKLKSGTWGLDSAFSFNPVSVSTGKGTTSSLMRTTDIYALNGVVPPGAPYAGSFGGPGPLIGDSPTRTFDTITGGAIITGKHELDAELYGFRVGAYYDLPLTRVLHFLASSGFAVGVVHSEFRYREAATVGGTPVGSATGSDSTTGVRVGVYAGVDLVYSLNDRWSIFGGAQYNWIQDFVQSLNGRKAELDFSKAAWVKAGVSFSF